MFPIASDNQEKVVLEIGEGERLLASKNSVIGTLQLAIALAPKGVPQIDVSLNSMQTTT